MDFIPDELRERWAERDKEAHTPKIATIILDEYDPALPELDYLEESIPEKSPSKLYDVQSSHPSPTPDKTPRRFHDVESSSPAPLSSSVKLHGMKAAGLGAISIASYAPKRISTTKPLFFGKRDAGRTE